MRGLLSSYSLDRGVIETNWEEIIKKAKELKSSLGSKLSSSLKEQNGYFCKIDIKGDRVVACYLSYDTTKYFSDKDKEKLESLFTNLVKFIASLSVPGEKEEKKKTPVEKSTVS